MEPTWRCRYTESYDGRAECSSSVGRRAEMAQRAEGRHQRWHRARRDCTTASHAHVNATRKPYRSPTRPVCRGEDDAARQLKRGSELSPPVQHSTACPIVSEPARGRL